MKKLMILVLAILLVAGVAGYFYLSSEGHVIELTESELQASMSEQLPMTNRYLAVTEVTLDNSEVSLKDGSDRIHVLLDVAFNFVGVPATVTGEADVSGGIKYVPEKHQFFVTDPEVDELRVEGVPTQFADVVDAAFNETLAMVYEGQPLYTLDDSIMREAAAKALLQEVEVQDGKLLLKLGL